MCTKSSLERYRGCLVGALLGDCLGAPFEGTCWHEGMVISKDRILDKISPEKLTGKRWNDGKCAMRYTDDTAMARCVSASLLHCNDMNSVDMATRFSEEFTAEPDRGYGMNVVDIFRSWNEVGKNLNIANVLLPSLNQFSGTGSYGNGGAMRVAPVALFVNDEKQCVEVAGDSARLTHSHPGGYNGAILQALAVYKCVHCNEKIQWKDFLHELRNEMASLEGEVRCESVVEWLGRCKRKLFNQTSDNLYEWTRSKSFSYTRQLEVVEQLLTAHDQAPDEYDGLRVVQQLGRDVSAQQSVPAALYCFLRNLELGFVETMYYSISLGGDTDTIATMCCAMAGAYYGYESIPVVWKEVCEKHDEVLGFADQFHQLHNS